MIKSQKQKIYISEEIGTVSALLDMPADATAMLVLAHGAGAGMEHPFFEMLVSELTARKIGTLRFNFPYMENGGAPDRPKKAHPAVKAAVEKALEYSEGLVLLAGGKSFGGRMVSQVAALGDPTIGLREEVKGIVYFGYPLHAAGKPGSERAGHLSEIKVPQLFLQGTRDALANYDLIVEVCGKLDGATLVKMEGCDHSFKTLKRSGITHEEVIARLAEETAKFAAGLT